MQKDLLNFYFSFDGRASRYDFNVRFAVVAFVGSVVAGLLDFFIINGGVLTLDGKEPFSNFWSFLVAISLLAVTCRRLHDIGYSGWWQLLAHGLTIVCATVLIVTFGLMALIDPISGSFIGLLMLTSVFFLYLGFYLFISIKRGTVGPNQYGPDPLEVQHVGQ